MKGARCTVLGASGFIGRHLVDRLRRAGADVLAPPRGSEVVFREDLGHVFYCIGLTADWRRRPLDAAHAHVTSVIEVLERSRFSSLLYLSSTRVYKRAAAGTEDGLLSANPREADDLFDISKMMGEAACLADARQVRVARLSNVYGGDYLSENFLPRVIRDGLRGNIVLRTSLASSKDYVGVDEAVDLLLAISSSGRERVYNVASGLDTSHDDIIEELVRRTGCAVHVADGAPTVTFPAISVERIRREFGFSARSVVSALAALCEDFRRQRELWERPCRPRSPRRL